MQQEIQNLKDRIATLEKMAGADFQETVRDIVFFDTDTTTALTEMAIDSNGDTVTIGKIPTKFFRGYFRGKVYAFAGYQIT